MQRLEGAAILVFYALAAISGGLGGCAVTAHQFMREGGAGRVQMRASWLLAYAIVGSVFGLLFAAYGTFFVRVNEVADIIGPSLISGIVGAAALGGLNMTARFILRRLGVEVIVTVHRSEKKDDQP